MFASVLIANRGEIACRIARTAKRLGMRTIAVYSEADAHALHTRVCDEAYLLGPAPPSESYLSIEKLIAIARQTRAECIHPGYGFLAENAAFADACASAGIPFIGPPPRAMRSLGLKDRAKLLMERAGVPIVPGYHGDRQEPSFLRQKAYEIGYPLLVKAVAGGGGRGMRRVDKHAEFEAALEAAQREAQSAFGDARVLIEKYITRPRHIEIQIFADTKGNVIHLNERDCSLQRRHQKVIEEGPAPGMTEELRARMGAAAVEAARVAGYVGAGTVEFIADGSEGLRPDRFWFMEMNTRLQVEHPVTEAICGVDLVEWQFRVAAGAPLPLQQKQVRLNGHAVEARLYAEDPEHGFLPSTGKILAFDLPTGDAIRVDTGVESGSRIPPFYDSLLAKVIAHANTREGAIDALGAALHHTVIAGPRSNATFLQTLLRAPQFRAGRFDTTLIDQNLSALGAGPRPPDYAAAALGAARLIEREHERLRRKSLDGETPISPWDASDGFQLTVPRRETFPVIADGTVVEANFTYGARGADIDIEGSTPAADARLIETEDAVYVLREGRQTIVQMIDFEAVDVGHIGGSGTVASPMHGKVLQLLVAKDETVRRGQRLAIVEAMKMEHAILAPIDGVVAEIAVTAGDQIAERATVMLIVPARS